MKSVVLESKAALIKPNNDIVIPGDRLARLTNIILLLV